MTIFRCYDSLPDTLRAITYKMPGRQITEESNLVLVLVIQSRTNCLTLLLTGGPTLTALQR